MFGLLSTVIKIFTNLCRKKKKPEKIPIFLEAFESSLDFVWIALDEINGTEFLFKTQEILIQSMSILNRVAIKKKKKMNKKKQTEYVERKNHHNKEKLTCLLEQILLETLALSQGEIR